MMICDADFDELFPAHDRREAAIMHPIWPTRLLVLMPAAAALFTANQVLQSMARSTSPFRA